MSYLPITLDINRKRCLIVGGGDVAARKLSTLLRVGCQVDVLSKNFNDDIKRVIEKHDAQQSTSLIEMDLSTKQELESKLLKGYSFIIAATNNPMINRLVSVVAIKNSILVNVVDNLELSSAILPAIVDRSPLLVAISTAGQSPLLARKIREKIEWLLPINLGRLFSSLNPLRDWLHKGNYTFREKKELLEHYVDKQLDKTDPMFENFEDRNDGINTKELENIIKKIEVKGKVYLVGAGPGDPDLLTVKALKLLQKADIVFHDALVSDDILELIRRDAKVISVGKRAGHPSISQQDINQRLINAASNNSRVIRLKGGDPFIFGRGGEELEVLFESDIEFEVVPGITAASGCASYAGIPLTHRDYSQSVHFVTGQEKNEIGSINWKALATSNQTLVFYMGLSKRKEISKRLQKFGLDPSTPVAVIENGTRENQRSFTGRIDQLDSVVTNNHICAPALIVVGEVVKLQEKVGWFKRGSQSSAPTNLATAIDIHLVNRTANL